MSKKVSDIIKLFKEKYDLNITFDQVSLGNPELDLLSEKFFYQVSTVRRPDFLVINKLKNIIAQNPDIPHFYNYLYAAYFTNKKIEAADEILDKINQRFPDYLFGVSQRALDFIYKNKVEQAKNFIGHEMDIKKRFPKECYHYSEVKNYYIVFFEMALTEKKFKEAKSVLRLLWELFPKENELFGLVMKYQTVSFPKFNSFEHTYTFTDQNVRKLLAIPEQAYDLEIFNILANEDIFDSETDFLRPYNVEYLCKELYKICVSLYHNFETIDDENRYVISTAFDILSTLNYTEAYPLFLSFIDQDTEFTEFFWHCEGDNFITPVAFNFGKHDPSPLLALLSKEDIDDYIRSYIFEALTQLVVHKYLHEDQLKNEYGKLLDLYIKRLEDGSFIPTYFLTMSIAEVVNLNDLELLEKAKPLFDANKIDTTYFGKYEDHLKEVSLWEEKYAMKHFPKDLNDYLTGNYLELNQTRPLTDEEKAFYDLKDKDKFEIFLSDCFIKALSGNNNLSDDDYEDDHGSNELYQNSKPIVKSNKIGRNDPCPCGSGKKFKKCCLDKKIFQ